MPNLGALVRLVRDEAFALQIAGNFTKTRDYKFGFFHHQIESFNACFCFFGAVVFASRNRKQVRVFMNREGQLVCSLTAGFQATQKDDLLFGHSKKPLSTATW